MKIDFRVKLLLTIVIGIVAIEGSIGQRYQFLGFLVAIFPYILAVFDKKFSFVFKGLFYSLLAISIQKYSLIIGEKFFAMILNLYGGIVIRILPGVMMGYYTMTTTSMSDLVYSLQKMKMPDVIIIPISVMFRFFYSIKEDYKKINEAMYMHGITFKNFFKNPMKYLEYKFVPLLMITSQSADNVAISAMTRAMKLSCPRTSISNQKFKIYDYILFIFAIILIFLFARVKLC